MTRVRRTPPDLAARLAADAASFGGEPPADLTRRVLAALGDAGPRRPASRPRVRLRLLPTLTAAAALAAALLLALALGPGDDPTPQAAPVHPANELFASLTPPGLSDVLAPRPLPDFGLDVPGDVERMAADATRRAGALVDGLSWPLRRLGAGPTPR